MRHWSKVVAWGTALAACLGCARVAEEELPTEPTERPATTAASGETLQTLVPEPTVAEYYTSDLAVIAPQERSLAAAVLDFTWTAELTHDAIPVEPVTGRLRGREFRYQYASVTPDEENREPTYGLRLSSKPRGELCSWPYDDDAVYLEWHLPRGTGRWEKMLGQAGPENTAAWIVLEQADGTPLTYTAADWAAVVQIDEVRGATEDGGIESLVGRLVLVFDDEDKSWVAGSFVADGCKR